MNFENKTNPFLRIVAPLGFILGILGLLFFGVLSFQAYSRGEFVLNKDVIIVFGFFSIGTVFLVFFCKRELNWFRKK